MSTSIHIAYIEWIEGASSPRVRTMDIVDPSHIKLFPFGIQIYRVTSGWYQLIPWAFVQEIRGKEELEMLPGLVEQIARIKEQYA